MIPRGHNTFLLIVLLPLFQCEPEEDPSFSGTYNGELNVQAFTVWKTSDGKIYESENEGLFHYDEGVACNLAVSQGDEITLVLRINTIEITYLFGERSFFDFPSALYLTGIRTGNTIVFPEQTPTAGLEVYSGVAEISNGGLEITLQTSLDFFDLAFIDDFPYVLYFYYSRYNYYQVTMKKI